MEAVKTIVEGAITTRSKNVKAFGTEAADAPLDQLNIRRILQLCKSGIW